MSGLKFYFAGLKGGIPLPVFPEMFARKSLSSKL